MAYKFNPLIGIGLDDTGNDADAAAGGSNTQIQYNASGALAGSADLTWDDSGKELGVGGDINLDDGGTYTTTVQTVTPTANRTISFPDATGTLGLVAGSSGQVTYNNAGAYAGVSTMTFDGTSVTLAGRLINSYSGTASSPAKVFTGTWFTGGTSTTTKPQLLIEPSGATSTGWSTSGTGLGVNAASGFTGRLLDLQLNGTSNFSVDSTGRVSFPLGAAATPSIYPGTDTNTGMWSPGADTLAFSTNGSERGRWDSSGRLLVGTSSSSGATRLVVQGNATSSTGTGSLYMLRGATNPTSGQNLSEIQMGDSGGNMGTTIQAVCDANWTSGSSHAGRLVFSTTADGAASPTERMRIKSTGIINFSNAPVYADNAAATTGGLAVGDVYRTSTGQLMIRY